VQRERWLQKFDQVRHRGATGKTGVPLQEILNDIRAGALLMSYWDSSALVKLYVQELDSTEFRELAVNASRVADALTPSNSESEPGPPVSDSNPFQNPKRQFICQPAVVTHDPVNYPHCI
jgi:hypothetical protein